MSHLRLWALVGRPEVQEARAFRSSLDAQVTGMRDGSLKILCPCSCALHPGHLSPGHTLSGIREVCGPQSVEEEAGGH